MFVNYRMSVIRLFLFFLLLSCVFSKEVPRFLGPASNVTVVMGRDATLLCTVENLHNYKVAWLCVDTQTVLTIGGHVITKNHRVGVTHGDHQVWALIIRSVRSADEGAYMCQINTEPMITQTHYLQVVVPPDIVDSDNSGEVVLREGDDLSLHCASSGAPQPTVSWRREDFGLLRINEQNFTKWNGEWLNITDVSREMNGAVLCIATNGVPPAVSKRILLQVYFHPIVSARQKLTGVSMGQFAFLQCDMEGNPTPTVYWTNTQHLRLENALKYNTSMNSTGYKHTAVLGINNFSREDIGSYHCHAENSVGTSTDDFTLYTIVTETTTQLSTQSASPSKVYTSLQPNADSKLVSNSNNNETSEDTFRVVLSRHQMPNLGTSPTS